MKIINKDFHDYYDSCIGYGGIDKTVIYKRKQEEFEYDSDITKMIEKVLPKTTTFRYHSDSHLHEIFHTTKYDYLFESGYIGFCGKIYPFIKCTDRRYIGYSFISGYEYYYDYESLISFLKSIKYKVSKYRYNTLSDRNIINFFKDIDNMDIFFKIQNPVFSYGFTTIDKITNHAGRMKTTTNPILKDFQFYKLKDAFSTFQDIYMFLSGVLGQVHPPIQEISDEVMKHKKGFGHKYAFKKEPTKKGK